uniref:No apical meristem-associated C-terminal domain-containing protein n=1 Tax=Oryza barthii TaxID=65489 RepID=A0A0D3F587_9ORYZ
MPNLDLLQLHLQVFRAAFLKIENLIAANGMQLLGNPSGRKKEKEKQHQHSDQSQTDALDHLWVKKKEADVEKERQRAERCKVASALDQQQIDLEKEMFQFKRMIVEDRIMRLDTRMMSIEEQD